MLNWKVTLSGLVIFSVGFGVGFFTCKKLLAEKYLEDLDEVRDIYGIKYQRDEDGGEPSNDDEESDTSVQEAQEYVNKLINQQLYSSEKGRPIVNYSKPSLDRLAKAMKKDMQDNGVYDPTVGLEEAEDDAEPQEGEEDDDAYLYSQAEMAARERMENRKSDEPYVIGYDEYMDGVPGYDKQALYYYTEDAVLCEDDDSAVEDEEDIVGLDYEEILRMQTMTWVRNDRLAVLYEIHKVNSSYKRDVLGVIETPREREFRLQWRRKAAMDD